MELNKFVEVEVFEMPYFRENPFFYRISIPLVQGNSCPATGESVKMNATKHTTIKRIQRKLQSNQSVQVDLERERRKMTSVSPRAVRRSHYQSSSVDHRPMASMSIQLSKNAQKGFNLVEYYNLKIYLNLRLGTHKAITKTKETVEK